MEIIQNPRIMQHQSQELQRAGQTIGLVPTMGALHEGHLSLIRRARKDCPLVVVSIFINPTQFGPSEDYLTYPRDIERDTELAEQAGAGIIFAPSPAEMYPDGYQTFVEVGKLSQGLCGASRPGHFRGVATVVCKLLNIIKPDGAYFGQKDYQQSLVIKRMAADLNIDSRIIILPTVREKDGLAISSRNTYLNPQERQAATVLHRALQLGQKLIAGGERDAGKLKACLHQLIGQEETARIDYIAVCHPETLEPLEQVTPGEVLIALAVKIGQTRLIDNCLC